MTTPQPPRTSPTAHLDVELLADLHEGLLDAGPAAAARAHLAGCDQCRNTLDALDEVRVLLREQGSETLLAPDDVVRRLDDALAAPTAHWAPAAATVTPLRAAARSPWRTRGLQAAAVFVLVAALGGLGYGGIQALRNDKGSAGTDNAASGGAAQTEKSPSTGRYRITSSGRDYTDATLRAEVPALLSAAHDFSKAATTAPSAKPPAAASGSAGAPASADAGRLRNGAALAACVANLAGGPVTPLAVDVGRFEGKPATIIVLPDPDDPSFVDAYAVQPDCATGTFLTYQKVALP